MNKRKLISGLGIGMLMITLLLGGCAKTNNDEAVNSNVTPTSTVEEPTVAATQAPVEATQAPVEEIGITAGIYQIIFTPKGRGDYVNYFHFYNNGVFYYSAFNAGQVKAGYYEVIDQDLEYTDENSATATAKQVIKMTNLDGSEFITVAYDQDTIWNVPVLYSLNFKHVLDSGHQVSDETGVTMTQYMLGEDDYSTVSIKHNGTYEDTIVSLSEGSWAKEGNVYTLTDTETQKSYTLTLSEDGMTADYAGMDGEKETLNLVKDADAVYTFNGLIAASYGDLKAVVTCASDSKLKMAINYANQEKVYEGSWKLSDDKATITLTIDSKEYTGTLQADGQSYAFDYTCSDGKKDVTFTLTTAK